MSRSDWILWGCATGQAYDRTAGAEAAQRLLAEEGYNAAVNYQMD